MERGVGGGLWRRLIGVGLVTLVAASCANIIGADFGDYRTVPGSIDAATGTGSSTGESGGASASGGRAATGGASGAGGSFATGGRAAQGGAGGSPIGVGGTPPCVPRACANVGDACGTVSNGCTGIIDCSCAAGACIAGKCCSPNATCAVGQCGAVSDGCQGTIDCGTCTNACADAVQDGSETAPDCGGPDCPACALGAACVLPRDCSSGSCASNVCATASVCTPTANPTEVCDGVDNDCDGIADNPGTCPLGCVGATNSGAVYVFCNTGRTWMDAQADCVAQGMNLTVPDSSAETTWIQQFIAANGVTDVWMGAEDRAMEGSWHWLGGTQFWTGGVAGSAVSGAFTKWNTGEPNDSAVTVGGEDCGNFRLAGWNDNGCSKQLAYVCERFTVATGCFDGLRNGTEADVDCGGSCGTCPASSACTQNTDCDTAHCLGSVCVDACADKVRDGIETDVDCGGGTCAKCATSKSCSVAADCTSANCVSNVCTAPATCVAASCPTCSSGAKCCKTNHTCGCSPDLIGIVCN